MNYFLAKTEPGTYSIDDLERGGHEQTDIAHRGTSTAPMMSCST